ncbi:cation:proton antiporter [Streptococcus dysgalactiae]|uniref:cation:proton antiporter n=1 Tax=Streptococcus dysgalactiae TaxID=1334 RepID=UPI001CF4B03B|nr:cation:proton antiporter [Streptococcus dysgalactiae]MCB2834307.1 cation:proton antiporter [Streptococcus dysgalactiae subsp. dysgalactiae]MCB2842021.1 cation:proton antiporter [Streptococcus dysgalactiae subsp. dysgalactiae]MCB2845841.1 cation:proton antiporter [Streptococcus dysgalactiae subsp. dysgalactiae]
MQTLLEITIILIASLMATLLANRLAIPAVVGQLCVGILIGPSLLNLVHEGHVMHFLAEIGVILLMFLAGLEANLELLRKYFKPSLVVAISGVVIPMVAFYYVGIALGFPINTAVFYGLVFAATSVSITVEVLQECQKVRTKIGAVILGAAVADDVLAVLLLSFFMSSAGASSHLVMQVGLEILFLVFLVFSVKLLVPKLYDWSQHIPYFEKETFLALLICLTWSLLAWSVGMSSVIGAFFAGLAVGQTSKADIVEHNILVIAYSIFIPIFFASIALPLQLNGVFSYLGLVLALTLLAIVTKLLPSYLVGRGFAFSRQESLSIGAGMVSRGEMALIIIQIGLAEKLITHQTYSTLVVVVILTTMIAPFILKFSFKGHLEQYPNVNKSL